MNLDFLHLRQHRWRNLPSLVGNLVKQQLLRLSPCTSMDLVKQQHLLCLNQRLKQCPRMDLVKQQLRRLNRHPSQCHSTNKVSG